MKNYRFGFSIKAFIAFILIMVPNIIWMISPLANDLLAGNSSKYPILDMTEYVSQAVMLAVLMVIINKDYSKNRRNRIYIITALVCLSIYYISWVLYYTGTTNPWLFVGMAFFPAVYFICVSLWLKNYIALIPTVIFGTVHCIITCTNFL